MVCQADHITSNFLKAVFHKFYLVHSWIPWPIYPFQVNVSFPYLLKTSENTSGFLTFSGGVEMQTDLFFQ